jgi:exopolysaccharide production negative regulator
MLISRRTISGFVAGVLLCASVLGASAAPAKYSSPRDALDQGIGAYNGGYYEIAVPALEYAADAHLFLAPYYLARIYSDNNSSQTDHAKAYELYLKIAEEHTDVDPDDDQRAPYVAKAMTQIAGYLLTGLPDVGLKPNSRIAAEYLREAAQFFRDEDAQFELAKLYLRGDGIERDVPYAKHWLSVLSQKGHSGAQAFLADLLWRGKHMKANPVRALALISVAVVNAPPYERVWIEDIYQNIYCGTANGIRKQATGLVADWRTRYGRKPDTTDHSGLSPLSAQVVRTCQNGEPVPVDIGVVAADASTPEPLPPASQQKFVKGPAGVGLRDLSTSVSVPAR